MKQSVEMILLPVDLRLFDGEGGGEGGAPASPGTQAQPSEAGAAGERKKEGADVQSSAKAGDGTERASSDVDPKERRKAYRELINGEYKDLYTEDTQRMLDRRLGDVGALQDRLARSQPVMDLLAQRYGVADGDPAKILAAVESDSAYWSEAAAAAGMSVEQFQQLKRLERENAALKQAEQSRQGQDRAQRQIQQWYNEAEALKARYPGFDLEAEVKNPQFVSLLKSGVPVEHAFKVLHMDEITAESVQTAVAEAEKRVTDNIKAKGARPAEAGGAQAGAFTMKTDVSKLTKKELADIRRRVLNGEKISFG